MNNMNTSKIIACGATLLLSSCGIYTSYEPQTSVPENLYDEEVTVSDTASIGNIHWRDFFTDPYLQDLIEKGLAQNTDVQTASLRVEEAKASLLSAKLAFLPSFALSPQGGINTVEGSKASHTYTLPVTASWELDIFGKLRNAKRQAKSAYLQSEDYKQAVYSSLIANIANTYYTLLMLDEQLEISRQTADTWKETVESTQALMDAGQADEAAVSQMRATYYEVENSVMDLEEQINQVENSLSLLLAETPHKIARGKLSGQQFTSRLSVGVPLQMLSNRPDVRMAERDLEQAFYVTNQANSAFYPSITLSGSAGWTNSVGGLITNPGKFVTSALASLTQPLFNRGTLIANRRIAVHRVRAVYYIVIIVESFLNSRYLCCPPAILSFFHRIAFHSPQIQLHIMRTVCPQIKSGSSSLPICHLCARMFFPVSATRSAFLIKCMNQTFVDRIRH